MVSLPKAEHLSAITVFPQRYHPAGKVIHVILDKHATHKAPKVREWLTRHPRFVFRGGQFGKIVDASERKAIRLGLRHRAPEIEPCETDPMQPPLSRAPRSNLVSPPAPGRSSSIEGRDATFALVIPR
ncbi:hypothetical protein A6A05_16205 [Magnetospirillum moscoviense]|uniref:Tc1-like transposase DDE domain-containing protein n=1 Tax=Magnetospirillum moscoviense TaxID=1437059 RepID=A0A178MDT2_9PROT|nr:hypothetical protein A6A05_16205 [Magnetospirillum moscoviense]